MSDKLSDEQIEAAKAAGFYWHPIQKCLVAKHSSGAWVSLDEKLARFAALLAASPAPAISAEPVPPFGWVQPRGGNYFTRSELSAKRVGGLIPVWTTPPTSAAPAISESEDAKRLDFIAAESVDLVSFAIQYEDDADIGWRVLQQHIGEAEPRVIGEVFEDDPRAAIDAARKGEKS
ncbi:hypothetical protein [Burkholderia glumae]|uniref:hypothetical protein n=1 Tax=Burkholderia glumae TaxID=337 RepID=UPI002150E6F0|nr:hypothetical protein [Burkholderia glumae]